MSQLAMIELKYDIQLQRPPILPIKGSSQEYFLAGSLNRESVPTSASTSAADYTAAEKTWIFKSFSESPKKIHFFRNIQKKKITHI